jgi:hypothetical protein
MHVGVKLLEVEPLEGIIDPILAVPIATMSNDRNLCEVHLQVVQVARRDVSNDVASSPRLSVLQWHVISGVHSERVDVSCDLVVVSASGRGTDEYGPV